MYTACIIGLTHPTYININNLTDRLTLKMIIFKTYMVSSVLSLSPCMRVFVALCISVRVYHTLNKCMYALNA